MKSSILVDQHGRSLQNQAPDVKKKAFGLFGSIYEAPNASRYRPRYYTNQDSEVSANFVVRDLQVRWSREMTRQLPFIQAAIRTLALYSVGTAYLPQYNGTNSAWGKQAIDWLMQEFYPNACKRGRNYDFRTMLFLQSQLIDVDGDFLQLYVNDRNNVPKVQIIPCHRIASVGNQSQNTMVPAMYSNPSPTEGPIDGTITADGVVYDGYGEAVGYEVINPDNLVNSMFGFGKSQFYSAKHAHLICDPLFIDKGRGMPTISSGILQALSLQEIQAYLMEKLKIESMIALIEKTPESVGPYEEAQAYQNLLSSTQAGGTNIGTGASGNSLFGFLGSFGQTADAGIRVVNTPGIRYIAADGDIKTLGSSTPGDQTMTYINNLESQIMQTLGVPHALLFSHDNLGGRISDGVIDTFVASIKRRQDILDRNAKFICGWAIAKAIQNGDLPPNDEENLGNIFEFTHPALPDLNKKYTRQADLEDLNAGLKSVNEIAKKYNKTADGILKERAEETKAFFLEAQRIAKETNTDINTVLAYMKSDMKINIRSTDQEDTQTPTKEN